MGAEDIGDRYVVLFPVSRVHVCNAFLYFFADFLQILSGFENVNGGWSAGACHLRRGRSEGGW
jgi:hypothetical protein